MMISNPFIPVQGCRWPEAILAAQGARWEPNLDRTQIAGHPHTHTHTHTHSLTQLGQFRMIHLVCTSSGCARKGVLEKTYPDMEKMQIAQGPQMGIDFLIIMKPH